MFHVFSMRFHVSSIHGEVLKTVQPNTPSFCCSLVVLQEPASGHDGHLILDRRPSWISAVRCSDVLHTRLFQSSSLNHLDSDDLSKMDVCLSLWESLCLIFGLYAVCLSSSLKRHQSISEATFLRSINLNIWINTEISCRVFNQDCF